MEFGVSVLKSVSGNKHTTHFVLYNLDRKYHPLRSIINRLPTDAQRHFIIDVYIYKKYGDGATYPCISRSASGESTDSSVVVYSSLVVVYSNLVVVYSSLECLQ